MKYIFDFDNVICYTNPKFREYIYSFLEKNGISHNSSKEYLEKEISNLFSLKKMLAHFSVKEDIYQEIMNGSKNFLNKDLVNEIKKLGKENCYIVTYGDKEFQLDKIKKAGINSLFCEIKTVSGSKKEAVEKICDKHKNEKVVFIDDKMKCFEDLNFKKYPNLQTIHFDEHGLEKLLAILHQQ